MSGWSRFGMWAFGLLVIAMPAYWIGEDRSGCSGGECDLSALNGLFWAVVASFAYLVIACTTEVLFASRRYGDGSPAPRREKTPTIWP